MAVEIRRDGVAPHRSNRSRVARSRTGESATPGPVQPPVLGGRRTHWRRWRRAGVAGSSAHQLRHRPIALLVEPMPPTYNARITLRCGREPSSVAAPVQAGRGIKAALARSTRLRAVRSAVRARLQVAQIEGSHDRLHVSHFVQRRATCVPSYGLLGQRHARIRRDAAKVLIG